MPGDPTARVCPSTLAASSDPSSGARTCRSTGSLVAPAGAALGPGSSTRTPARQEDAGHATEREASQFTSTSYGHDYQFRSKARDVALASQRQGAARDAFTISADLRAASRRWQTRDQPPGHRRRCGRSHPCARCGLAWCIAVAIPQFGESRAGIILCRLDNHLIHLGDGVRGLPRKRSDRGVVHSPRRSFAPVQSARSGAGLSPDRRAHCLRERVAGRGHRYDSPWTRIGNSGGQCGRGTRAYGTPSGARRPLRPEAPEECKMMPTAFGPRYRPTSRPVAVAEPGS